MTRPRHDEQAQLVPLYNCDCTPFRVCFQHRRIATAILGAVEEDRKTRRCPVCAARDAEVCGRCGRVLVGGECLECKCPTCNTRYACRCGA